MSGCKATAASTTPRPTSKPSMASAAPLHVSRGLERLPVLCATGCALPEGLQRFYFLRHGQTARNALRIFQSVEELLNATGLAQAEQAAALLAEELAGSDSVHILCSDAPRALTTARAVARQLAREERPHAGLRERHFGALIGSSSAN